MALPNTYDRLDYIQSSGSQYINTGITGYTAFKLKFQLVSTGSSQIGYFGSRQSGATNRFGCMNYNGVFHFMIGNSNMWNESVDTNTHELDFNSTRLIDNGVEYATPSGQDYGSSPFYLFACYNQSTKASMRIEYFQQLDGNGNITKNLIPAKRKSDNVVGLYDDINSVFYTNAGSGSFTYGSIVYEVNATENPTDSGTITGTGLYPSGSNMSLLATANSGYIFDYWELDGFTRLEYIESTGTQRIETEIRNTEVNDLRVNANVMWTGSISDNCLVGLRFTSGDSRRYFIYAYQNKWNLGVGTNNTSNAITINQKYKVEAQILSGNSYLNVDDETLTTLTGTLSTSANYGLTIFCNKNVGSLTGYANARVYDMKFYKASTNELIRDYIPVIRHSDGAIGLLDLVEMKFYGNDGTGTFIGGGVYAS